MPQNTLQVLQTRNLKVYYKAYSNTNTLPAAAAYGVAWTGYTDAGLTSGGAQGSMAHNENPITSDQTFDPIDYVLTDRTITLQTAFEQMDANLIKLATGMGTVTSVAAASGTRGTDTMTIDSSIPVIAHQSVGFEGQELSGEAFQYLVVNGRPSGTVSFTVGNVGNASTIPVTFNALPGTTSSDPVVLVRSITPALP